MVVETVHSDIVTQACKRYPKPVNVIDIGFSARIVVDKIRKLLQREGGRKVSRSERGRYTEFSGENYL
jgi:hypothetical protein